MGHSKIIVCLLVLLFCSGCNTPQCFATEPPSWDLLDDDCSSLTGWVDGDTANGVSQVNPSGQFDFAVNPADTGEYAQRINSLGDVLPDKYTLEIKLYHDAGVEVVPLNAFSFFIYDTDYLLAAYWGVDFFGVFNGSTYTKSFGKVELDHWDTWRFVVDASAGAANAVVDVYKDKRLVGRNMDCAWTFGGTAGDVQIVQYGYTNSTQTHIDYIKIATGNYGYPLCNVMFINER